MDFINELQRLTAKLGFGRIQTENKIIWVKEEINIMKMIEIVPELLPGQRRRPVKEQEEQIRQIENKLAIHFGKRVDRLTLMIFRGMPDEEEIREIAPYPNIWCLDKKDGNVFLYEQQRTDFYGMREVLERFMIKYQEAEKASARKELYSILQPVTFSLVMINVAVFLLLSNMGDVLDASFMAEHGAMVFSDVIQRGEYYRIFTSTFLHFGLEHLTQNMLSLLLVGSRLERITGKIRYLCIYLGAGAAASAASLFVTLAREPYTVSAGASGAVFGVMGGLLFLILKDFLQRKRSRINEIGLSGIIFMIVSALSYGFTTAGVDNAAHLGGLAAGFILTGIFTIWK